MQRFGTRAGGAMSTYFSGGTIWQGHGKTASSLRIADGKIVEIDGLPDSADEIFQLNGGFLLPGFMDGHAHPLFAGRESQGPQVNGLQSVSEIIDAVRNFAEQNPDSDWIVGGAYEAALVERGDFIAEWLDEAVRDRPVILHAADHHTIWVNSLALQLAGIDALTPDPDGGSIARNEDGSPRGTLREPAAIALITQLIPERTIDSDVQAINWACQKYLESGVTSATDAWIEDGMSEAYLAAEAAGALTIDMSICFLAQPESWQNKKEYFLELRGKVDALGENSHLSARTIKFLADGAFSSGTAAVLQPYLDNPKSSGLLIWEENQMLEAALHFDAENYQLHIHAIGDAAVRQALNVIEGVISRNPIWDRRPVIVHAQLIDEQDLPRFAQLGVIANFQPLWMYLDPMNKELIAPRLGDERNNRQYELATLVRSGVRISFGSDWPVTDYQPLLALAVPTTRKAPGAPMGAGWSEHQSVSVEESLVAYTEGVAYQSFNEQRLGRLELGMSADLVILERNPLTIEPEKVAAIKVLQVYKSGLPVFK